MNLPATFQPSNCLKNDLIAALDAGEFVVYYQLLWNVVGQCWDGAEALVRWQHPVFGLIQPDEFIPLAEKNGFILPLGNFVLRTACQQMNRWHESGLLSGAIAVNISPLQLHQLGFIENIEAVLDEIAFCSSFLELEITETLALEDTPLSIQNLKHMRKIGVRISIDDFGMGNSSLARLLCCPVTRLKIDKSFIDEMNHSQKHHAITRSILSLGHNLGLSVVAEGVETQEQRTELELLGCDVLQGVLFTKPCHHSDIEVLMND